MIKIPIQIIKGLTLDTLVEDCLAILPPDSSEAYGKDGFLYISLSELPDFFEDTTRLGEMLYLENPVCAITTRTYLNSINQAHKLANLFQEKGEFIPYNPKIIKEIKSA